MASSLIPLLHDEDVVTKVSPVCRLTSSMPGVSLAALIFLFLFSESSRSILGEAVRAQKLVGTHF